MKQSEIEIILTEHKKWLDSGGREGKRANLRKANLAEANLCSADLREANLCGADLCGADLCGADLRKANLAEANLCCANLCCADLREVYLREADLRNIKNKEIVVFDGPRDFAYYCDGYVKIGCMCKPLDYWLKNYERVGREHGYQDVLIKEYGMWLKSLTPYYSYEETGE